MLRRFKVELEVCGPAHATQQDVFEFIEKLKSNKDITEEDGIDIFAIGNYEVHDEGEMSVDEWNGDEKPVDEE